MESNIIIVLSLLSIFYIIKNGINFIYYVLIYNILVDVFSLNVPSGGIIATSRAIVLLFFFFHVFIRQKRINLPIRIILIYSIYTLILVFFSSNILYSLRIYTKVIISILYFCIGYLIIIDVKRLRKILRSLVFVMLVMIINTLLANYFGFKGNLYNSEQLMGSGNLFGQSWNIAAYSILLVPLMLHFENRRYRKIYIVIITIILFVMMLFNLSRIPILSTILGLLIFAYFLKNKRKVFKFLVPAAIVLMVLFILLGNTYLQQIEIRKQKYELDSYEEEARFLETRYVIKEVFSFTSMRSSFFGKEFMNSGGNYANGRWGDRQLHIDYNNLLHGSGIIGLFLYFLIFFSIYYKFYKIKNLLPKNNQQVDLIVATFHVFFIIPFIMSLSGQMYSITFRSIDFIFLGALLKILIHLARNEMKTNLRITKNS